MKEDEEYEFKPEDMDDLFAEIALYMAKFDEEDTVEEINQQSVQESVEFETRLLFIRLGVKPW